MWVLSCEDESLFKGKRPWLRPGGEFLIGRTTPSLDTNQRFGTINLKSISRHHLTIKVKAVEPGSSSHVFSKPQLVIVDHSKIGTTIDSGEKISKRTVELNGNKHELVLGNWDKKITVEWQPVVFTATSLGSAKRRARDPFDELHDRVEPLGFKIIPEYQTSATTHVVATKRNIPPVLNALVDAKHIVTTDFVDAVCQRATGSGPDFSGLEEDIGNWPKEEGYLPPPGKEPVPRPSEHLLPNDARKEVFAGYTFVFCDAKQFESLLGPITGGTGKALLYKALDYGKTPPEEFAAYVKSVAGEKDVEELEQNGYSKGVVVVRMGDAKDEADEADEAWRVNFIQQSDLLLGQRSIAQNEFLDAILMCDAKELKKGLEEEIEFTSTAPAPSARESRSPAAQTGIRAQLETSGRASATNRASPDPKPATRKPRRPIVASRFNAFDDFDPSQISKSIIVDDDESMQDSQSLGGIDASQSRFSVEPVAGKKRRAPELDAAEREKGIDELFPAAAAAKRLRLAKGDDPLSKAAEQVAEAQAALKQRAHRKKSPDLGDVKEKTRQRLQAQQDAAQQEHETVREMIADMDIDNIRGLAKVETMDLPERPMNGRKADQNGEQDSERWKAEWNGRKNFKKFRRKGENGEQAMRGLKVIVQLEEVKKKSHGLGEEYWLETSTTRKGKAGQSQRRDTQTQAAENDDDDGDDLRFRSQRAARSQAAVEEDEAIDLDAGPTQVGPKSKPAATSQASSRAAQKRPAADDVANTTAAKKAKTTRAAARPAARSESDDDDEDMRFRFKSRRG